MRPLPRVRAPVAEETVVSYLGRLAKANRLEREELLRHLDPGRAVTDRALRVPLVGLAAATNRSITALAYALPELRAQHPQLDRLSLRGRTRSGNPNTTRPACRRCMAIKGIGVPAPVWVRHDQNVCLRHRLWIGPGVERLEDQSDLIGLPEVVRAQQRHRGLVREHGHRTVAEAFAHAQQCLESWLQTRFFGPPPFVEVILHRHHLLHGRQALTRLTSWHLIQYPEVVTLTGMFVSPYWRRVVLSRDEYDTDRFHYELGRRLPGYLPGEQTDKVRLWIRWRRRVHERVATGELPAGGEPLPPAETHEPATWSLGSLARTTRGRGILRAPSLPIVEEPIPVDLDRVAEVESPRYF